LGVRPLVASDVSYTISLDAFLSQIDCFSDIQGLLDVSFSQIQNLYWDWYKTLSAIDTPDMLISFNLG
jgi:hypothetical protein